MITSSTTYLIVNADDLGMSPGVNQGIFTSHERGILTSASLMVRWPAVAEAITYSREHPALSLGLHIDLAEWAYCDENWLPLYQVVPADDATAVTEEIYRQLATFRSCVGRDPSHLDSHQHIHLQEPVRSIVMQIADELNVPLRHYSPTIRYCGEFYGQTAKGYPYHEAISVAGLLKILASLEPGVSELCSHPGTGERLDTMYWSERQMEVKTLCDPRVRATLETLAIQLCSFEDIP